MSTHSHQINYNFPEINMDIEDTVPSQKPASSHHLAVDKRNECLPSDLVPENLQAPLREFVYSLFASFKTRIPEILEWSPQQFRRFCDKAVLEFRRTYRSQPAHCQIGYVYRQLRLLSDHSPDQRPDQPSHFEIDPEITMMFEEWCLKKRSRCSSGVTVFSLMTSPHPRYQDSKTGKWKTQKFSCRHNCYYCPNEPAHKDNEWQAQARSYLYHEPTVRRANRQHFSPSQQIWERGQVYLMNGHPVDKMEIIILGGTWSEYPRDYQEWFLGQVYWAANHLIEWCRLKSQGCDIIPPDHPDRSDRSDHTSEHTSDHTSEHTSDHTTTNNKGTIGYQEPKDTRITNLPEYRGFKKEQEANSRPETVCRIVGLTIETRPDAITPQILEDCRNWGVTRIQIGVQHTDQTVLDGVNRGCTLQDTIDSTRLMQDYGFKIVYHWMPDLPGSSPVLDREMWRRILFPQQTTTTSSNSSNSSLKYWDLLGDEWKIYPFSALPWSVCESWVKDGRYKSYGTDTLIQVLVDCYRWMSENGLGRIRIVRLIRDIPVPYIKAGNRVAHLRQVVENYIRQKGDRCVDIRSREIRDNRPALSLACWRMTVRRTLATRPVALQSTSQPSSFILSTLVTLLVSVFWQVFDTLVNIFYPGQPGRWYWGNPLYSTPMKDVILRLPLYFEPVPETLSQMVKRQKETTTTTTTGTTTTDDSMLHYGYECFLSLEGGRDYSDAPLYGFLRLRLTPSAGGSSFPELQGLALVRELHVYGRSRGIVNWETSTSSSSHSSTSKKYTQHHGVGSTLLKMAEYTAWKGGFQGIAIIAGVGVRGYYHSRGYTLESSYMVKRW